MAVCCMSAELRAQIRVNSEIERQLRVEHLQRRAQERRQVDLLLVGRYYTQICTATGVVSSASLMSCFTCSVFFVVLRSEWKW